MLGLALAAVGIRVLQRLGRHALPRLDEVGLDAAVLLFALVATAATAVAFGVAPALRLARDLASRGAAPAVAFRDRRRGLARLRGALAAAQVALALTLLAGAGVLLASFHRLQQVDARLPRRARAHLRGEPADGRYDAARRASFQEELARRLETIPGVTAAGGISRLPATGSYHPWNTQIRSGPLAGTPVDRSRFAMQQRVISGDLLRGARDSRARRPQLRRARRCERAGPGGRERELRPRRRFPACRTTASSASASPPADGELEIVGVVGDVALDVYGAPTHGRLPRPSSVRRQPELGAHAGRRRRAIAGGAARVPCATRWRDWIRSSWSTGRRRWPRSSIAARAGSGSPSCSWARSRSSALALAALGLYGVLAYTVRQRTTEIGIRIALGATAAQVRALVFRQAAAVVSLGVAAGLAGALVLGRWLEALAFGIAPSDPRILMASAVVLALVALVAAWLPAQRAARVEPRIAMQEGR